MSNLLYIIMYKCMGDDLKVCIHFEQDHAKMFIRPKLKEQMTPTFRLRLTL